VPETMPALIFSTRSLFCSTQQAVVDAAAPQPTL